MESEQKENPLEESSVTMVDILQEERELEEEYNAVLGASDEDCCTYSQGAIKRQALYSCLTCCPDGRNDLEKCAGICLACSYRCHENHELVELYTKRNFRCDCPTERFTNEHRCQLNPVITILQARNSENLYNQNFQGLYCKCQRPYPDPERTSEEVMLQCTICEDWFHLQHLDVPGSATKLVESDACAEMICSECMQKHAFIQDYTGLALKTLEEADESLANVTVIEDASLGKIDDNKLHSDLDKSISDIMKMSENATLEGNSRSLSEKATTTQNVADDSSPKAKRQKLKIVDKSIKECAKTKIEEILKTVNDCKRPRMNTEYQKGATFWGNDWRDALCQCSDCMNLYKMLKVEYLLDKEDSAKSYEERGKRRGATNSTYEQGIRALASIDRVQQIDAITEYNRMKDKLKDYLQTFAVAKKVVTEADINRFFEEMRNENNAAVGQPYFCR